MKPDNAPTLLGSRSYYKMRQFLKTVADAAVPERLTGFSLTTPSWSVGNFTAVSTAAAYFAVGDVVVFTGTSSGTLPTVLTANVPYEVTAVFSVGPAFTVKIADQTTGSSLAVVTAYLRAEFREAFLFGKFANQGSPNTTDAYVGPLSADGKQPLLLSPDGQYILGSAVGEKQFLSDWYLDIGLATEGAVILYH